MSKVIRIKARIDGFSDNYCLLQDIEELHNSRILKRSHLWVTLKPLKEFKIGDCVELTGNTYYYAKNKVGLHKIRKVVLVNVD